MKPLAILAAGLTLASIARADVTVDYTRQIKPILQARCYACHGVLKQKAGLRLDSAALAIKGGKGAATIVPGDAEASVLIDRISSEDDSDRMPPEGEHLKPSEIAAIRAWIDQGAKAPADERPERDPRDHWAFKRPVRPPVPVLAHSDWAKNPIDAFIGIEHQKRGLTPQGSADKRVWLRRVSLDLVGLPPTTEEFDAFIADTSPDAYEHVVDKLLASPQYGEHWGRHWMDVWRYTDWWGLGAEVRNSQKHIWHWRDWIIESLNADKGYDQMLREMLAADELYPDDLDRLRASGFLARQYFKFNRTTWLDETVEHTGKAMLGLTFNCAKCHDHKYDPFSQVDYYRLRAVFEPYQVRTESLPGVIDFEKDGLPRAFDCNLDATTYVHVRGDERNADKSRPIAPGFPAFLSFGDAGIKPVALPAVAYQPGLRPFVVETLLKAAETRVAEARKALDAAKLALAEAERPKPAKPVDPKPIATDDFSSPRADLWEIRDGDWTYAKGRLVQSKSGNTRATIRLKPMPPADFEARLTYTPTGGDQWKSVGIVFDVTASNEVLAYLSSVTNGTKAQVAYKHDGPYVYPTDGAEGRPIALGERHELIVRVRGTLVNLVVDGRPSVAYRLPNVRVRGPIEIITFDARAELHGFALKALPPEITLVESKTAKEPLGTTPVDQAKAALALAEKTLRTAEAQPPSIRARAAADRARYQGWMSSYQIVLMIEACRTEREAAAAKVDEALSRAELEAIRAETTKRADAAKAVATAKAALDAARKAIKQPSVTYTPLPGAYKTLESNLETEESRTRPFPTTSTGRRSALARWITDPKHPLPARVAINHIWARHFGKPLVPTVFDFGRKGTPPTHPELLDWLAVELVEHGWSTKHIHRLIVTSNTYRLASTSAGATNATLAADPENRYYWRANPTRMEAQVVRDSLLRLSGELDLKMGGASIAVNDEGSKRRSLYFVHSHNEHQKFLAIFDDASVLDCYRRAESIVPQQALALENSPLAASVASKIAARITSTQPGLSDRDFTRAAFLTVLAVDPSEAELAATLDALTRLTTIARQKGRKSPDLMARTHLVQALLNHNDFITVR
jgi:mono/diheme cytochrome c family protein